MPYNREPGRSFFVIGTFMLAAFFLVLKLVLIPATKPKDVPEPARTVTGNGTTYRLPQGTRIEHLRGGGISFTLRSTQVTITGDHTVTPP